VSGRHRIVIALCLALVTITVVALWQPGPRGPQKPVVDSGKVHTDPKTGEKYRIVGGVQRKLSEIDDQKQLSIGSATKVSPFKDVGRAPLVPRNANPMVASVSEALSPGRFPERLSPMVSPKRFDADAYRKNPELYLNTVEPGRVFQCAQPGPNVPALNRDSKPGIRTVQGETVSLKVRAPAGAPVTFTSFDSGAFQNRLPSITVAAGDDGVAIARFTGTPGTYWLVNILAGSPLASGRVSFVVDITLPEGKSLPWENQTVTARDRR
jgi:hypothetical protein